MTEFTKLRELSEKLLEKVLLDVYNQDSQELVLGDYTKNTFLQDNKVFFDEGGYHKSFKRRNSLRPVYPGPNNNVLGRIYDSVMIMCQDNHPEFRVYAVCLSKQRTFFGRIYSNAEGGIAIVLGMGLFNNLYAVNRICNLVLSDSSLSNNERLEYLVQMFRIILHCFGDRTLEYPNDKFQYKDNNEFMAVHFITNSQQQFILLHEYGHIATSYNKGEILNTKIYSDNPTLENELSADEWAAKKIATYGKNFYIPWVQLRSLLWLFEFIHFVEIVGRKKKAPDLTARKRYDLIKRVIDPKGTIYPMSMVEDMRQIMDDVVLNWELINQ